MKLLGKISTGNIIVTTEKTNLKFSYNLQEQDKELQIAAGKIHLGRAGQAWKIEVKTLTLTTSATKISFQKVKEYFEEMVTA